MKRYSEGLVILNKDLQSGMVKKKEHKDLIEYWVYAPKQSKLYSVTGKKLELEDIELRCIIVCDRDHIVSKTEKGFFIKGVKFTDGDINEYRTKSRR